MDDKQLLQLIHTGNEVRKSAIVFQAHVTYRLGECVHGLMSWAKKHAKGVSGGSNAQQLFKDRIKQLKMFGLTKAYGLFNYYVLCSVYRESPQCLFFCRCLSPFVVCVLMPSPRVDNMFLLPCCANDSPLNNPCACALPPPLLVSQTASSLLCHSVTPSSWRTSSRSTST